MSSGPPFLNRLIIFAMPTVRNLLRFQYVIEDVCWSREDDLSPLFIMSLVIPSIPWAVCLVILLMTLSTSVNSGISSVSGLDLIVFAGMGTVWV